MSTGSNPSAWPVARCAVTRTCGAPATANVHIGRDVMVDGYHGVLACDAHVPRAEDMARNHWRRNGNGPPPAVHVEHLRVAGERPTDREDVATAGGQFLMPT